MRCFTIVVLVKQRKPWWKTKWIEAVDRNSAYQKAIKEVYEEYRITASLKPTTPIYCIECLEGWLEHAKP
jgi:hypothetical protein